MALAITSIIDMISFLYSNTQQRKHRTMNIANTFINIISSMKQSRWILPALVALALISASLGVTGCSPPHHGM